LPGGMRRAHHQSLGRPASRQPCRYR
jgi:hypothetical protein